MSRNAKAEARAINAILWQDWDPIGCGVPEDEYESCVWPVYKLLTDGAPREDVVAYLRRAGDENITVSVPEERLQRVVDKLMALGVRRTGRTGS
jgi:hypothetical protein